MKPDVVRYSGLLRKARSDQSSLAMAPAAPREPTYAHQASAVCVCRTREIGGSPLEGITTASAPGDDGVQPPLSTVEQDGQTVTRERLHAGWLCGCSSPLLSDRPDSDWFATIVGVQAGPGIDQIRLWYYGEA